MDQQVTNIDMDALRRALEPSVETGQATAGGALTLTDSAKNWAVDAWQDLILEIVEGRGKGQIRKVMSNTATVITIDTAWATNPDATSYYRLGLYGYMTGSFSMAIEDGKNDVASVLNILTDTNKNWNTNVWIGFNVRILTGTGAGAVRRVISNTATELTVDANWPAGGIAADSRYNIYPAPLFDTAGIQSNNIAKVAGTAQTADDWTLLFRGIVVDYGTASGGTLTSLTDGSKRWGLNTLAGCAIKIVAGTGVGNFRMIQNNGATLIGVVESFTIAPDVTSKYVILRPTGNIVPNDIFFTSAKVIEEGISELSGVNTLVSSSGYARDWGIDRWKGYLVRIINTVGTYSEVRRIISNTIDTLTVDTNWGGGPPPAGTQYAIFLAPLLLANGSQSQDLTSVAGTAQTAYDWTNLFRAVTKDEGIATVPAIGATLTDTPKKWDVNMWRGHFVRVVSGTGAGQVRIIASNTLNVLTVTNAWDTQPTTDSRYAIFQLSATDANGVLLEQATAADNALGLPALCKVIAGYDGANVQALLTDPAGRLQVDGLMSFDGGTATAGGAATLTDTAKNWDVDRWAGYILRIDQGTGAGQTRVIASNTDEIITVTVGWVAGGGVVPDATSVYVIMAVETAVAHDGNIGLPDGDLVKVIAGYDGANVQAILTDTAGRLQVVTGGVSTVAAVLDYGTATGGAVTGLVDAAKDWAPGSLTGCIVRIVAGTGIGQLRTIRSNIVSTLVPCDDFTVAPDATSQYVIYAGKFGTATQTWDTLLLGGTSLEIFTAIPTLYSNRIVGQVYSDVASAVNGLSIGQSIDGANWDYVTTFTVSAGVVQPFDVAIVGKYVRVLYTNGAIIQATFRASVSLKV